MSLVNIKSKNLDQLDVGEIRSNFPILQTSINGKVLAYLDNAASSQMPSSVIKKISDYHQSQHSNIHRGVHYLSETATEEYEGSREKIRQFINAEARQEIIFTRGATSAINMVANGYVRHLLKEGDEIIVSYLEHHANIVPWQIICEEKGAKLKVLPIDDNGDLLLDEMENIFSDKTKMIAITHVSNALGTVNPVKKIVDYAHKAGVPVLIDGAQAVPHSMVDVREIGCDFYVFSGHKMCGPTGIGILYGKTAILDKMQPVEGGGDMILSVSFEKTIYNELPYRFEAGTPPIAQAIGLGAAVDYLSYIGLGLIEKHEQKLLHYALKVINQMDGVRILGSPREQAGVISFNIEGVHPHDVGTLLNDEGIAVRTGHHCAQPVMKRFGVPATARASFYLYNTESEIDRLVVAIENVKRVFA